MIKKYLQGFFLALLILPISTLAYPTTLIPGGENIGINIHTTGVIVAGIYEVNNEYPATKAGIKAGDIITSVSNKSVSNIDEMIDIINQNKTDSIKIEYLRNDKNYETTLELNNVDGIIKTGLYVKDSITGIGTLSFIDPETKLFGALGHEIVEKNTGLLLEVKNGTIFSSSVTKIDRSSEGTPGSKNALFYQDNVKGNIQKNTHRGIFGTYTENLPNKKEYAVALPSNIKLGNAKILTVINGEEIKEYDINILKLNESNDNKNILFEIVDSELLEKTGGVVQGMSGSTIIQGDYIIGAVNYVVVDNPKRGYGIFITNMLDEMKSN